MKDQVVINSEGIMAVFVPVFRNHNQEDTLANMEGYSMCLFSDKPIGYLIDSGTGNSYFVNAEFVEKLKNLTWLGDL